VRPFRSRPSYDIESCVADLETIRNYYNVENWIIGGHSWGADLALLYALEHSSRVAGLMCIASGRMHDDREWHAEYKKRRTKEGEYLPEFLYPPNPKVNRQVNASWKRYIKQPDLLLRISKLQIPALFVYGERDIRPSWPPNKCPLNAKRAL